MRLKVVGRNFTLGALNHPEKQTNEQTDRVKNKTKQNKGTTTTTKTDLIRFNPRRIQASQPYTQD